MAWLRHGGRHARTGSLHRRHHRRYHSRRRPAPIPSHPTIPQLPPPPPPRPDARPAPTPSTPPCPPGPRPAATTPAALSPPPFALSSRTACPIVRPVGIYGGITESLSPLQPFRIGSRRRGKKAERTIEQEHLDHALAGFSGYIAADELYDGPFCVLSIVDNH